MSRSKAEDCQLARLFNGERIVRIGLAAADADGRDEGAAPGETALCASRADSGPRPPGLNNRL
jgi:hypothetical protein